MRVGPSNDKINLLEVCDELSAAGAAAIIVHGRTAEDRYKRAADWEIISKAAALHPELPIVGVCVFLSSHSDPFCFHVSGVVCTISSTFF